MKRIVLFLVTNLAIMLVLSVTLRMLGVDRFMSANGLNVGMLLIFSLVVQLEYPKSQTLTRELLQEKPSIKR